MYPVLSQANINKINNHLDHLEKELGIQIGVSAVHIESGKFYHHRADESFKMASTMKLPVAIYLLDMVNKNKVRLDQMVKLEPYDLVPGSGSMGYYLTYPSLSISVHNLLESMMAISDNTSTDAILNVIGGPKAVMNYLKQHYVEGMRVDNYIMDLFLLASGIEEFPPRRSWTLQKLKDMMEQVPKDKRLKAHEAMYSSKMDRATPRAMTNLLVDLKNGSLIGGDKSEMLLEIMSHCLLDDRIVKDLPKGTKVAHKTGSWDKHIGKDYKRATFSDVGIIYLPGEKGHIAISVYTHSNKTISRKKHFKIMSKAAKLVYDELG